MLLGRTIKLFENKNLSYRLYFTLTNTAGTPAMGLADPWNLAGPSTVLQICQDENLPVALTNTPVAIGAGMYYIDLTASEMNADLVYVAIHPQQTNIFGVQTFIEPNGLTTVAESIWEYDTRELTTSGSGMTLDDIVEEVEDLPTGDLSVRQVLQIVMKRLKRNKRTPKL